MSVKILNPFINGRAYEAVNNNKYSNVYNPATGDVIARAQSCSIDDINMAVQSASDAFPAWSATPVSKRVEILYRVRDLLMTHLDELTYLVSLENGKTWHEAQGDVLKAKEGTEQAIAAPSLMMGESMMDASVGYDMVSYNESVGVFAGIVPFNFPAMIPMGWMAPICIACGNTIVLKAATATPQTALRIAELYHEAGLPDGVLNVVTCSRSEAEILLSHPDVRGITFVGSTTIGKHIYARAAANGKRVQALCEAKNHALVLNDAPIEQSALSIINSAFGCAGERCMALPVVVAQEDIADALVAEIREKATCLKLGPGYDGETDLGPVVSAEHMNYVSMWIQKGIDEGATLVLDGRNKLVKGFEKGFYLGPTIFDHVTSDMTVGSHEIFGPVLCIKRVKNFSEGLTCINQNPLANGAVIYTQSGHFAREFARHIHAGMVGINVGIPVPLGIFPFSGHKWSFLGDLHVLGKDGYRFYTQKKTVTSRWFHEECAQPAKVSTWDGTI